MKVFTNPIPSVSIAMIRVAHLLDEFSPSWVEKVDDPKKADLQILHVLSRRAADRWLKAPRFAAIQYVHGPHPSDLIVEDYCWMDLFDAAELVWSYYDLEILRKKFYFSPLGIPKYFAEHSGDGRYVRDIDIFTSGMVSGKSSESIEEVAEAAKHLGKSVRHLGPKKPKGMTIDPGPKWHNCNDISDSQLSIVYQRTKWVSGLRQVEGFEYPVIEGLISGARPIVFDRPDMRKWYDGHAVFIPECHGEELVEVLVEILNEDPEPVSKEEQKIVARKFNRKKISRGFWSKLRKAVR